MTNKPDLTAREALQLVRLGWGVTLLRGLDLRAGVNPDTGEPELIYRMSIKLWRYCARVNG